MSERALAYSDDKTFPLGRPRARDTILYGGLVAGVLDITYALTASGLRGVSPTRVLHYVASGLLGPDASKGGLATTLLGLLLHFLIAFSVAAIYYGASLGLPVLIRRAVICGPLYGMAVHIVMSYIVVPLSAIPRRPPFSLGMFLINLAVHAFFIGLPIALFARRSALKK
jgi:hypothetical protein